jgi:hypothetical protein
MEETKSINPDQCRLCAKKTTGILFHFACHHKFCRTCTWENSRCSVCKAEKVNKWSRKRSKSAGMAEPEETNNSLDVLSETASRSITIMRPLQPNPPVHTPPIINLGNDRHPLQIPCKITFAEELVLCPLNPECPKTNSITGLREHLFTVHSVHKSVIPWFFKTYYAN